VQAVSAGRSGSPSPRTWAVRRLIPRQAASCLAQYLAGALNQGRQSLDQLLLHSRGDSLLLSWEI